MMAGGILKEEDILRNQGDVGKAMREKEAEAAEHYKETGSYPAKWEMHICVHKKVGRAPKFVNSDEYFSKGIEYFEICATEDEIPTISGLTRKLGFTNKNTLESHIRRNPEYRDAHATFMNMLQGVQEWSLNQPGSSTSKMFLIKNIPDGLAPTDAMNQPMTYAWQDKKVTELTGLAGGPIQIKRDESPEEAYLKMLDTNAVLEDEREDSDSDSDNDSEWAEPRTAEESA